MALFRGCALAISRRMMSTTQGLGPVATTIQKKLSESLEPAHMDIINESYMHNVPKGSETHFKVVVVSSKFENAKLIERHRIVNSILSQELSSGVHALSINAYTPAQWTKDKAVDSSPRCMGGFGK
uniref:Bola-like protein ddb_g0274169 n=1 Tax=Pseudodiaptomus poplesia TaxID=213370 RepID=A0A1S6GL27_9MAXI|nr:bola-like protein ddb_g0274169 [Pseudodiaptomus poplesia]